MVEFDVEAGAVDLLRLVDDQVFRGAGGRGDTGLVGGGEGALGKEVLDGGIEEGFGDDVTGEGIALPGAGGVLPGGEGAVDGEGAGVGHATEGEIAVEHFVGGDGGTGRGGAGDFGMAGDADEEEGLVLAVVDFRDFDDATDEAGGFVVGERVGAGQLFEVVAVDHALVDVAVFGDDVEVVGAGLHDHGHEAAGGVAVFGGHTGGVNFHFFKGVLGGGDLFVGAADVADAGFLTVDAVDLIPDGAGALAEDVVAVDRVGAGVVVHHADGTFLADGNGDEGVAGEDEAGGGGFGIEEGDAAGDLHGFGDAADFHLNVDTGDFTGADDDAFADVLFESGGFDGNPVGGGREIGDVIGAFGVGGHFGSEGGGGVDHRDLGSGDDGAGGIGDGSDEGTGSGGLGEKRGYGQKSGSEAAGEF